MADVDVLIVGAGVAGAACAEELRAQGFTGSILLAGREADPPYHRPPVSKGVLAGTESATDALVHSREWWAEQGVDLRTRASVTKLDTQARVATLSTRDEVSFDRALLATGANVRRLAVDGSELDGIHYLRAPRNAAALREDTAAGGRVVLVGGSFIGAEVAATLTTLGRRCAVVMQEDLPLVRVFGEQAGRWCARLLAARGVEVHGGQAVERLAGNGERVQRVICAGGLELDADAVVLGVGAVPDVTLARAAGLALGDSGGIRCDAALATSAPQIWAAGDVCEYDSVLHGRRVRIEHWDVAMQQGRHAARAMLGATEPYAVVPYFYSDLADWASLEYVGLGGPWDDEELRGTPDEGAFAIVYRRAGAIVGALGVGRRDELAEAAAAVTSAAKL